MTEKLKTAGLERFNEWFQSRVKNGCPFCDSRDWSVHDELGLTSTVEATTHRVDARHGAPMIQVTCNQCAFTAAFSATRVGLIDPDQD